MTQTWAEGWGSPTADSSGRGLQTGESEVGLGKMH